MLWEAAWRGKLEMVKYLAERGADIDARGTHYTPYFVEVSCYCIVRHRGRGFDAVRATIKKADRKGESVRILLDAGADPLHANRKGETPQSVAERRGASDLVDALGREP